MAAYWRCGPRPQAPELDQEVRRDQRQFPEDEERKQIERYENAHVDRFKDHDAGQIEAPETAPVRRRKHQCHQDHESGQRQEQHADAVDAEMKRRAQVGHPGRMFGELNVRGAWNEFDRDE